jgi:hypothetical protein
LATAKEALIVQTEGEQQVQRKIGCYNLNLRQVDQVGPILETGNWTLATIFI